MNIRSGIIIGLFLSTISITTFAEKPNDYEKGFAKQLAQESRSEKDRARDAGRKPQKVMQFLNIKLGMRVLELLSAGGYYTEVLSYRVGEKGEVLAHNNQFLLNIRDGMFAKQMTDRLANNRLKNVTKLYQEFNEIELNNEIDAVTMILNYHDMMQFPLEQRQALLAKIKKALKADGIFAIIDAQENPGERNPKLHRINRETVVKEITDAGFKLAGESDVLRNDKDDHTLGVFDPSVRGKTDRFLLKFRK